MRGLTLRQTQALYDLDDASSTVGMYSESELEALRVRGLAMIVRDCRCGLIINPHRHYAATRMGRLLRALSRADFPVSKCP